MIDKLLVIIYFYTVDGEEIAKSDFDVFYKDLKKNELLKQGGIRVEHRDCPSPERLNQTLEDILSDTQYEEVYLHFSGHGSEDGIPYDDWVLGSENLAIILDEPKVKFCFFASCKGEQLVQIVSGRKIPIVIGTRDNNVDNKYAIEFEQAFYKLLLQKESFYRAFEKAYNVDYIKNQGNISAGTETRQQRTIDWGAKTQGEDNELQILFYEEDDKNRHLISPSVVEAMSSLLADEIPFILVYAGNESLRKEFKRVYLQKGFDEHCRLFLLNDHDLTQLAKGVGLEKLKTEDIKVLFLIQSENDIFQHEKLAFFDDEKIFNSDLKFALAIKNGINEENIFKSSTYFKDKIAEHTSSHKTKFHYDDFDALFENNDFDKYIHRLDVDLNIRKNYIINNFKYPSKKEVHFEQESQHLLKVLFAPKKFVKLLNYIINWWAGYLNVQTPIIVSKNLDGGNQTAIQGLEEAIKSTYKDNPTYTQNLPLALTHILLSGHILIIHTELEDFEELKKQALDILAQFDSIPAMYINPLPKHPTYLFFINDDDFSFSESKEYQIAKTKNFTKEPDPINKDLIKKWTDMFKDENQILDKIIIELLKIKFEKYEGKCPSGVIAEICDHFKIPQKQILSIS